MKKFDSQFSRNDVTVVDEKVLYQGFYLMKEYQVRHQLFGGGESGNVTREVQHKSPAVCVLPYDPVRDEVVLIEQFRIGALSADSPWMLEIVAGMVEEGESLEEVAQREVQEESGLQVNQLIHLHKLWVTPGGSDEVLDIFCGLVDASDAGGVHGLPSENEDIRVHVFSRSEVLELLSGGGMLNAPIIIALQWLEKHWHTLKDK